jgi:hypothetical protein
MAAVQSWCKHAMVQKTKNGRSKVKNGTPEVFQVLKESALHVLSNGEKNETKRRDEGRAAAVRRSMECAASTRP